MSFHWYIRWEKMDRKELWIWVSKILDFCIIIVPLFFFKSFNFSRIGILFSYWIDYYREQKKKKKRQRQRKKETKTAFKSFQYNHTKEKKFSYQLFVEKFLRKDSDWHYLAQVHNHDGHEWLKTCPILTHKQEGVCRYFGLWTGTYVQGTKEQ